MIQNISLTHTQIFLHSHAVSTCTRCRQNMPVRTPSVSIGHHRIIRDIRFDLEWMDGHLIVQCIRQRPIVTIEDHFDNISVSPLQSVLHLFMVGALCPNLPRVLPPIIPLSKHLVIQIYLAQSVQLRRLYILTNSDLIVWMRFDRFDHDLVDSLAEARLRKEHDIGRGIGDHVSFQFLRWMVVVFVFRTTG